MTWAQFYHRGVQSGDLIEACGDRSVLILDGRNNLQTMLSDAEDWGRKHGFLAFDIRRGPAFTRPARLAHDITMIGAE